MQTALAFLISRFGGEAIERMMERLGIKMSPDRILTLIAGAILSVYSIVLGVEYYRENCGGDGYNAIELVDREEYREKEMPEAGRESGETTAEDEEDITDMTKKKKNNVEDNDPSPPPLSDKDKNSRSLALIAFIGSLDDLTLFVPMLAGKTVGVFELTIGASIATLMIIVICFFVTECRLVADALERLPLVAIVVGFTVFLLAKGILFMD